jgi:uncharacterized protein (DUF3084 family)
MPKIDEQISTLQDRLTQLKLRQQRLDMRKQAREAQRERKAETRRKFIVGALVLDLIKNGEFDRTKLTQWLDRDLERREDRALFDLPPRG